LHAARLRDLRNASADVRGVGPTDVGRARTDAAALVRRRRPAIGIRRGRGLVGRHEQHAHGRLAVDLHVAAYELIGRSLNEVGLLGALHLVHEEVVLDVRADGSLPRLLVDGDAEHHGTRRFGGQEPAAILDGEWRHLERDQDERVEGVLRDLDLALLEGDPVALEVVERRRSLRERAGGQDHGHQGHGDDERCGDEEVPLSHMFLFFSVPRFEA